MKNFKIRLAEKIIEINALYPDVYELCADYICGDECTPDFCVASTEEGIEFEKNRSNDDSGYSDGYLETLSIYRDICERMLAYDAFLMHGSVVADSEAAYMFVAASGVGKTTRTNEWLRQIEGSFVVNGDKPLLKIEDKQVYACGTPWSGKEKLNTNIIVPLRAIIILERADKVLLRKLSFAEAFVPALQQIYRPEDPGRMAKTLELFKKLDKKVDFYKYYINLDDMDMKKIYEAVR